MRYITLIILIGCCLISQYSFSQDYHEELKQSHTFKINASGTLEVINKYGTIYVEVWDKDSVKVDIDFIVSEKSESRFNKTKSNVSFDISGNSLYRSVKTLYGSNYSSFFKDLKEATNMLSSNEEQTHVDYYITIPNYINLKIDNKYGNIILPSLKGDINISLSNGDLQAKNLSGNTQLNLSFGNLIISNIEQGNLLLNFMETSIEKGNNLTLDSKSSNVNINKINLLKLDARRGKVDINNANYIFGDSEFCELYFNNLNKEISLNIKYGILKKLACSTDFEKVNVKSLYANLNIYLPNEAFYITTYNDKTTTRFNKKINWSNKTNTNDSNPLKKTGYYLKENSSKEIIIDASNAEIEIN